MRSRLAADLLTRTRPLVASELGMSRPGWNVERYFVTVILSDALTFLFDVAGL